MADDFTLLENERKYLKNLVEVEVMKHVGSGPKDPAPKEKETKSPVEDSKGEGTAQAGTDHPNRIPPLAALKKDLAKEDFNMREEVDKVFEEMCGSSHNPGDHKKKKVKEQAKPDFLDVDKDKDKEEPMKKAIKDKEEGEVKCAECGEEKDKCKCPGENEKDVEEQLTLKQQARMKGGDQPQYVPGSPAEKRARAAANVPPMQIQKMRRPVPTAVRPVKMGRL